MIRSTLGARSWAARGAPVWAKQIVRWFIRSQPQMVFNWKSGKQVLPLDFGAGRVFKIGRQDVSLFVEPFWNISHDGPAPRYGITFGASLLYPDFWGRR